METEQLLGGYAKARTELGWKPEFRFQDIVTEMVQAYTKALADENRAV